MTVLEDMPTPSKKPAASRSREKPAGADSFAGWKLDMIAAMASDPELRPGDVRVAIALLQAMNSKTRRVFPSQETIADLACMQPRNVQLCLKSLMKAGWLDWSRGNRQLANSYEFDDTNMQTIRQRLEKLAAKRAERRKRRSDTQSNAPQEAVSMRNPVPVATRTPVPVATRSAMPSNTSMEHLNGTHEGGALRAPLPGTESPTHIVGGFSDFFEILEEYEMTKEASR